MSTTIDSLEIKIETGVSDSVVRIEKLAEKLEKLKDTLVKLNTTLDKIGGNSKLPNGMKGIKSSTDGATNSVKKFGSSLSSMDLFAKIQNLQELVSAFNFVADAIAATLSQAMEWDGIQFRFGRAFGEDAEETYAYIQKVNEALGINIQQFMQYSSLYGSLLSGFGMAQEKITTISVGLTELSYDIWAAYNDRFKSLEDASEAVRSAITGEIEPIRNAGIALTESSLQEFIDGTNLAGQSIEKMTEAQKSEIRYAAMMDAAMNQGIVGTYAREMNTAEGAVRSLSQSFKTLVQALGSLFIPALQVVIPYVTAFVEIITDAIRAIARFFGIEIAKINWGSASKGVGGVASGANDAASGLGKAAKAAKQLKDYTMGFDELNVISPDSGSGAGGGGGGGIGGGGFGSGLGLDTLWNDSIFEQASKRVGEIKEKLKKALPIVAAIGAGFLAWKFGDKFKTGFALLQTALAGIAGKQGAMDGLKLLGFDGLHDVIDKIRTLLLKTPIGSLILGSGATSVGAATAAIVAAVAAITAIVSGVTLVYKNSENFREGISAIAKAIGGLFDGIGDVFSFIGEKFSELTSKLDPKFLEFMNKYLGDFLITAGGLALFGPWGLAIEGAVLAIKGIGAAAKDSIPSVDLFGEGISEATREKVEPFLEKMTELENSLLTIDWGNAIVSESDLANISAKLKSVTDTIISELDSDENEALANLDPLRESMSDEKFKSLQKKVKDSYEQQRKTVAKGEDRINDILAKASKEARALTEEESDEINQIRLDMKNTGVKYLSESQTESNLILQRMKDNATKLSAEQASNVIKSALEAKKETIKAAEEQYESILLEAQRMLDVGVINKEEYDEIVKAAETTRDDTIDAAEKQYDEIVSTAKTKMGEYAKYIDEKTGEIKSNWKVFCEDFSKKWSEILTNVKNAARDKLEEVKKAISDKWASVKSWYNSNVAPKFTWSYWAGVFDTIRSGLASKLDEAWTKVKSFFSVDAWKQKAKDAIDAIASKFKMPSLPRIGLEVTYSTNVGSLKTAVYKALGLSGWPNLRWYAYAQGGFPSVGEAFIARENGPELVGRIGNRSAVANNDQIVSAVAQGVYSAVVAAMGANNNGGNQNINVYLDGKQIHASFKRTEDSQGASIMGNQLGYLY